MKNRKIIIMESISIQANLREELGKRASNHERKAKLVPCVIYGGGENIHISCEATSFKDLIYSPEFRLVDVSVNDSQYKCIIKDVQFHPVTEDIVHVDFLKLVDGAQIKVDVPLRIVGTSPGVTDGGRLVTLIRKVAIKTTPKNLVSELFVDISSLLLGSSMRISDIDVPEGVEILNAPGSPVASVIAPRVLKTTTVAEDELLEEEGGEEGEEGEEEAQAES